MDTKTVSNMIPHMEEVARSAILQAGEVIRGSFGDRSSFSIHSKSPFDYVTDVDKKSESVILDRISGEFPDHHIMSEETANAGLQPGITWVIDPLDGTTNFIHGFSFVAVSIAACLDGEVILGMVLDPLRQELFWAKRGEGAYLNGKRLRVRSDASLDNALIATGFPFRSKHLLDVYLKTFKEIFLRVSGIRRAGAAALDLAYLAAGRVDGFWEAGLKPWDIAAGILLIREAGGLIGDFRGKEDYLRSGHIIAGTASVYPFLLEQAKTFMAPELMDSGARL